ncbi:MAG: hypothetical protein WKF69_12200, partial [Daejeonella sp.]
PPDDKTKTAIVPPKTSPAKSTRVKKPSVAPAKGAVKAASKVAQVVQQDSIPLDTAKSRIIIAYHNAKIFKTDLQARADSMFFSYSDSTVRCYFNPIVWAQGSQLTGDTIYLQMKDKKLNNMLLQHNSFIVNSEDTDSTKFNQVKGKVITGLFRDNKLRQMYVDGNAETVYYVKDDSAYISLNHSISSRINFGFLDGKLKNVRLVRSVEGKATPMDKLTEEDKILKGFIWKPKDRPKSKEEIIPQLVKVVKPIGPVKTAPAKAVPSKTAPSKAIPSKEVPAKTSPAKAAPVKKS